MHFISSFDVLYLKMNIYFCQGQRGNKMCYETQMPPYEANSRGGHHHQNPTSRFKNLRLQYKGLVIRNMHMKYKSPITYHSKHMAKVKVFKKWVKLQGQVTRSKNLVPIERSFHMEHTYEI
jgi:hypothetical protein